jgi:hypothetical protein
VLQGGERVEEMRGVGCVHENPIRPIPELKPRTHRNVHPSQTSAWTVIQTLSQDFLRCAYASVHFGNSALDEFCQLSSFSRFQVGRRNRHRNLRPKNRHGPRPKKQLTDTAKKQPNCFDAGAYTVTVVDIIEGDVPGCRLARLVLHIENMTDGNLVLGYRIRIQLHGRQFQEPIFVLQSGFFQGGHQRDWPMLQVSLCLLAPAVDRSQPVPGEDFLRSWSRPCRSRTRWFLRE